MEATEMISSIESILFAADRPINLTRIAEVLTNDGAGPAETEISDALAAIKTKFEAPDFGFELREGHGGFQLTTKAKNSDIVRKFLATKPFRLGRSALETMSIIAYRQPITRAEIDVIRGIDSSHLLRLLIERGMVRMVGKAEIPGRPVVYGTTTKFLETVGLPSLNDLPPLTELDQLQGDIDDPTKRLEAGLEKFIATNTMPDEEFDNTEGLQEIDTMLQTAGNSDGEIYASPAHREVAEENKSALACFQATIQRRRAPKIIETSESTPEIGTDANSEPLSQATEASLAPKEEEPIIIPDELLTAAERPSDEDSQPPVITVLTDRDDSLLN